MYMYVYAHAVGLDGRARWIGRAGEGDRTGIGKWMNGWWEEWRASRGPSRDPRSPRSGSSSNEGEHERRGIEVCHMGRYDARGERRSENPRIWESEMRACDDE